MKNTKGSKRTPLPADREESISSYIKRLIKLKCRFGSFMGHRFYALSLSERGFRTAYNVARNRAAKKLENNYQYQKVKKQKYFAERELFQAKKNILKGMMEMTFPELNFQDHNAVLDWLHLYGKVTNDKDIMKNHSHEIVFKKLSDNGYFSGMNIGEKFIETDEKNFAQYLIGQLMHAIEIAETDLAFWVDIPAILGDCYSQYVKKFRKANSVV